MHIHYDIIEVSIDFACILLLVCHADELAMQFVMPRLFHIGTEDENYQFSKDLVKVWVDFARDE